MFYLIPTPKTLRQFDECRWCGDYRHSHKGGTGKCFCGCKEFVEPLKPATEVNQVYTRPFWTKHKKAHPNTLVRPVKSIDHVRTIEVQAPRTILAPPAERLHVKNAKFIYAKPKALPMTLVNLDKIQERKKHVK